MKNLIIIRNGNRMVAEGDTIDELEQAYERFAANPPAHLVAAKLPKFSAVERCHLESEGGKLCILDTRESPHAARSYYNVGFESEL